MMLRIAEPEERNQPIQGSHLGRSGELSISIECEAYLRFRYPTTAPTSINIAAMILSVLITRWLYPSPPLSGPGSLDPPTLEDHTCNKEDGS